MLEARNIRQPGVLAHCLLELLDAKGDRVDRSAGAVVIAESLHKLDAIIDRQDALIHAINAQTKFLARWAKRG